MTNKSHTLEPWKPKNRVYQTPGDGQCFRACLATLLGVPLADVPETPPMENDRDVSPYWNNMRAWCRTLGFDLTWQRKLWPVPLAPHIVGCESCRGVPDGYAAIMLGDEVVHDPFPGGGPIEGITRYILTPLYPDRQGIPTEALEDEAIGELIKAARNAVDNWTGDGTAPPCWRPQWIRLLQTALAKQDHQ